MHYIPFVIIMPLYNHEQELPRAIESVLKQKTDFQFRLLIIDDRSTDNSLAVAKKFQVENPVQIDIIENEKNWGLLQSITRVYSDLNCDYYAVLDPDDYYTVDDKFQRALSFLEQHPDFTCYFANVMTAYPDGKKTPWIRRRKSFNFDFQDYKRGKFAIPQTSGGIFRNVIFNNGLPAKFVEAINSPYSQYFRADGFRCVAQLFYGKAHYENRIESVYSYNGAGLWSRMQVWEQCVANMRLFYALAQYFDSEKLFFLNQSRNNYNSALSRLLFRMITFQEIPDNNKLEQLFISARDLQKEIKNYNIQYNGLIRKISEFMYKALGFVLREKIR